MCVVNVVVDRIPQAPLQVKVEHRSVGKVHFLLELTGVFCQLISVGRHVSDKYGIQDCAHCKQDKSCTELHRSRSWHNLTNTEQVESSVESNKIGAPKVCILAFSILPVGLVGSILRHIHEVHVLDPALLYVYKDVP